MQGVEIIGHRGSAGTHPENTLAGIAAAIEAGADGVEVDVRLSRDGQLVLLHDAHVNRTTNSEVVGPFRHASKLSVAQLHLWQLGQLKIVDREGVQTEERIPTLSQAARLMAETSKHWFIELKEPFPHEIWLKALLALENSCPAFRALLRRDQIHFLSFHHTALAQVGQLMSVLGHPVRLQPLVDALPSGRALLRARLLGTTIGADQRWLTEETVQAAQQAGLEVHPYTVNNIHDARRVVNLGIRGFTTDLPADFVRQRVQASAGHNMYAD